mmetsp:Transcript_20129/g.49654  ORF Transcript_20129/g.49654 Transcript_20129/m.49654 type:complete len:372 (+) Transcript_20129:48-1163(+)
MEVFGERLIGSASPTTPDAMLLAQAQAHSPRSIPLRAGMTKEPRTQHRPMGAADGKDGKADGRRGYPSSSLADVLTACAVAGQQPPAPSSPRRQGAPSSRAWSIPRVRRSLFHRRESTTQVREGGAGVARGPRHAPDLSIVIFSTPKDEGNLGLAAIAPSHPKLSHNLPKSGVRSPTAPRSPRLARLVPPKPVRVASDGIHMNTSPALPRQLGGSAPMPPTPNRVNRMPGGPTGLSATVRSPRHDEGGRPHQLLSSCAAPRSRRAAHIHSTFAPARSGFERHVTGAAPDGTHAAGELLCWKPSMMPTVTPPSSRPPARRRSRTPARQRSRSGPSPPSTTVPSIPTESGIPPSSSEHADWGIDSTHSWLPGS